MEVISQLPGLVFFFPRNLEKVLSLSLPRRSLVVHFWVQQGLQSFLTRSFAGRGGLGGFGDVPVPECLNPCSCWQFSQRRRAGRGVTSAHKWAAAWLHLSGERGVKTRYLGLDIL